ncbi:MAG: DUF2194 domain-containing protein [Chitinophagales bacterium]
MESRNQLKLILVLVFFLGVMIQLSRTDVIFSLSQATNSLSPRSIDKQVFIPPEIIETEKQDNFLIIYSQTEELSKNTSGNLQIMFKRLKKHCDVVETGVSNNRLSKYGTVIITVRDLDKVKNLNQIIDYVKQGGNAFFTGCPNINGSFLGLYRKLGIYELGPYKEATGIRLCNNVLIRGTNLNIKGNRLDNYSMVVGLEKSCLVYALSSERIPLFWSNPYGKGQFLIFNGTMLDKKDTRGLIIGGISFINQDFIYPVLNLKLAFIDDFPAPLPETTDPVIYEEYGRDVPTFYRDIWWKDMLSLGSRYDLKYNAALVLNYDEKTSSPFTAPSDATEKNMVSFGREILKNEGELGIHGYNHQPLAGFGYVNEDLGYKPWKNKSDMIQSIQEVKSYLKILFPNYALRLYVPPSNILSPEGEKALREAIPGILIISGLYPDDSKETGYFLQEFEARPDNIVYLPRITSGYNHDGDNLWNAYNGITELGVFSHFVHPDDVLDASRNHGRVWKELYNEFDSFLKLIHSRFGWLRSMTASQAALEIKQFGSEQCYIRHSDKGIEVWINNYEDDVYFILRTRNKLIGKGCDVSKIDDGVFLIQARQPAFQLVYKR